MPSTKFIKIDSDDEAVTLITQSINDVLLSGKPLLWLISGGSFVPIAVAVRRKLQSTNLLTVTLTDERHGLPGHNESNWHQLSVAGFDFTNIHTYQVLNGGDINETTEDYNNFLGNASGYVLGAFGMGADGHTAGILPGSNLSGSQKFAESYTGPDFDRITVTPKYISTIDRAVVYAKGESKHTAIDNYSKDFDIEKQPVQILKTVPDTIFINDYKGESFENYN